MQHLKKLLPIAMIGILGLSMLVAGCQTSKKPMTPQPNSPSTQKPYTNTPNNNTNTNMTTTSNNQQVTRAQNEAQRVSGVRSASAIISGRTMYIGLDLDANLGANKSAMVEKEVLNKEKKMFPAYTVMVSSDIDTVTRIKKVARGIASGTPLTSFSNEIKDIGTRMAPRTQ